MNDFTKEELQKLLDWCVSRASRINTVDFEREGSGRLFDKIQSTIDNYDCQVINVWHCEKCGHVQ